MRDEDLIRFLPGGPPDWGTAKEVAQGVLWMRLPLPMALDHVNIYAIADGDGWAIIDTGGASKKSKALWEQLLAGPLAGKPVRKVIVTHHHPDHVGAAGWLVEKTGAPLMMSRTAWLMTRMLVLDEQPELTRESEDFMIRHGVPAAIIAQRQRQRPFNFCDVVAPLGAYQRLEDGDRLLLGDEEWLLRRGDGHAPEQLVFFSTKRPLVLGADQFLPDISPNVGVYPSEPDADPLAEWLACCEHFKEMARPDQLILPGHKQPYYGLPTRLDQLIDNHISALARLEEFLRSPHTVYDMFDILYRRKIGDGEFGLALAEAVAHINHLHHQGRAHIVETKNGVQYWQG